MGICSETEPHYKEYKTYIIVFEQVQHQCDFDADIIKGPNSEVTQLVAFVVNDERCKEKLSDEDIADVIYDYLDRVPLVPPTPFDFSVYNQDIKMVFISGIPFWSLSDKKFPIKIEARDEPGYDLTEFSGRRNLQSKKIEKYNKLAFCIKNKNLTPYNYKYTISFIYKLDDFVMPIDIDPELGNNGDGSGGP